MKRILSLIAITLMCSYNTWAQSFNVQYPLPADTVYFTYPGTGVITVEDSIYVPTGNVTLKWNVIATDFPSDWIAGTGICDNSLCYNLSGLWPSGGLRTSSAYSANAISDFHLQLGLASATSSGTHYIVVRLYNASIPADTAIEVYAITYMPSAVPNVNSNDNITLYPNPATNSINAVYSPDANVKVIAVYNMIGKMMVVNKVGTSSANINIENLPSGVYFMRLVNSGGDVVATRKFTKD